MKKLFKTLMLSVALVLPFAAFAQQDERETITAEVVNENAEAPVEWVVTAEDAGEGIYTVTFDATIKEGFHGYPMTDFSAPIILFDDETLELVGEMTEPLTPVEHGIDDLTGEPSYIYYDKAIYVQQIKAAAGQNITGFIQATICTNDTNQCTANPATFSFNIPGAAASAEVASEEAASTQLDWSSLIQAILWGFAALLTPCVFPMVPMTVSREEELDTLDEIAAELDAISPPTEP